MYLDEHIVVAMTLMSGGPQCRAGIGSNASRSNS